MFEGRQYCREIKIPDMLPKAESCSCSHCQKSIGRDCGSGATSLGCGEKFHTSEDDAAECQRK